MSDLEQENSKFAKIAKDPLPVIGMTGFFSVVAYSIYNYRKKGTSYSPSVYVIQTRMAAQGLVICLLTLGAGYQFYKNISKHGLHNPHDEKIVENHTHDAKKL